MSEPHGQWIREPKTNAVVVFVHGILSSGDTCWRAGDVYWPELLTREESVADVGVYVFSYRADALAAGYSLGDAVEALNAYLGLDKLLDLQNLIFVCHSMGGIVVRQFLVTRQAALIDRNIRIGLFLLASPSLGSNYANLLSALAKAFGNTQAQALRFADNNTWLNDLDRNFINLKESERLFIRGQELVEDDFIVLRSILRRQVVRPFAGARYFGESLKIPNSNHFTIAKPIGRDALQHRLLLRFIVEFLRASAAEENRLSPSIPLDPDQAMDENTEMVRANPSRFEAQYRDALRRNPESAEAHNGLGMVLYFKEDLDGAAAELHQAIRLNPQLGYQHNNLGCVLIVQGKLEDAEAEFREAFRVDPSHAKAHANLAAILLRKGDRKAALEQYRIASRLRPNNTIWRAAYEGLRAEFNGPG